MSYILTFNKLACFLRKQWTLEYTDIFRNFCITSNVLSKWPLLWPNKVFLKVLTYEAAFITHGARRKCQQIFHCIFVFLEFNAKEWPKTPQKSQIIAVFRLMKAASYVRSFKKTLFGHNNGHLDSTFDVMQKLQKILAVFESLLFSQYAS